MQKSGLLRLSSVRDPRGDTCYAIFRQPDRVGVRLGVWRRLGRRYLPVRRRDPAAVRQGVGGDLLQGAQDCARQRLGESLVGPAGHEAPSSTPTP
jgi:hypothetical protein